MYGAHLQETGVIQHFMTKLRHTQTSFRLSSLVSIVIFALLMGFSAQAKHPSKANLIGNVEGSLQMFGAAAYNSLQDEYFAVYAGKNVLCGVRIDTAGRVISNTRIGPEVSENIEYNIPAVEYAPITNTYLVSYRRAIEDQPNGANIRIRHVSGDGTPLSQEQTITTQGGKSDVAYNPVSNNYLVAWSWVFNHTNYRMVDAVPSDNAVLGQNTRVENKGWLGHAAFSTGANKFLFVNGREHTDGTNGSDIWGHFVTSDGSSVGGRFPIATTGQDETGPSLAYASSTNKWMVMWQRFIGGNRSFDIEAGFVDENGNVEKFFVKTTALWDSPGDVVYNESLDRFVVAWFAGSGPRIGLVNPHDGSFEAVLPNDSIVTPKNSGIGDGFSALATRPHPGNPQAFVYWREGHGLTGAHGTIVDLNGGFEIPVTGGGIPCTDTPVQTPVLPVDGGDDEPGTFIPNPTPEILPELKVEKFVRNVTRGQTASRDELPEASAFEIVQFITLITSQTDRTVSGLVVHDQLPQTMEFRDGSTLIDGSRSAGRAVIEDGLAIGSIEPGRTRTVRWTAQVNDTDSGDRGVNTLELPVVVTTDDAGTFFSNALLGISDTFIAARSTDAQVQIIQQGLSPELAEPSEPQQTGGGAGIFGAVVPSTGAGGTVLLSILGAVLTSLAYAGYTRTGRFHRKQLSRITSDRDSMDFRL